MLFLPDAQRQLREAQGDVERLLTKRVEHEYKAILNGITKRYDLRAWREANASHITITTKRRHRWERRTRHQLFSARSLDAGMPGVSGDDGSKDYTLHDAVPDPRALDPLVVLTGVSEHHLEEILGDLSIEDVARMDERTLAQYRERILDAGLAPSSVQRKERERLKVIVPHRGAGGGGSTRGRMQARHRGRKAASQVTRGRRSPKKPRQKYREAA